MLKICLSTGVKISQQPLIIKLRISSGPTRLEELRPRIAFFTSELEMVGTFNNNNNNNNNKTKMIAAKLNKIIAP
jgi:hypothetical protein